MGYLLIIIGLVILSAFLIFMATGRTDVSGSGHDLS